MEHSPVIVRTFPNGLPDATDIMDMRVVGAIVILACISDTTLSRTRYSHKPKFR